LKFEELATEGKVRVSQHRFLLLDPEENANNETRPAGANGKQEDEDPLWWIPLIYKKEKGGRILPIPSRDVHHLEIRKKERGERVLTPLPKVRCCFFADP
jgi:hypothetical protein